MPSPTVFPPISLRVYCSVTEGFNKLEAAPFQVGVRFFQVGNKPSPPKLNDNLGHNTRDIGDMVNWNVHDSSYLALITDAILSESPPSPTKVFFTVQEPQRHRDSQPQRHCATVLKQPESGSRATQEI